MEKLFIRPLGRISLQSITMKRILIRKIHAGQTLKRNKNAGGGGFKGNWKQAGSIKPKYDIPNQHNIYQKIRASTFLEAAKNVCGYTFAACPFITDLQIDILKNVRGLYRRQDIKQKCMTLGVDGDLFDVAARDYGEKADNGELDDEQGSSSLESLVQKGLNTPPGLLGRIVLADFLKFLANYYPEKLPNRFESIVLASDLTNPPDWYQEARRLNRKIIMHVGPTNSGKTYHALKRFYESSNCIYCGPLRLLAHEIYERSNSQDVACNLVTGEERRVSDDINRWSCTIEMANLSRAFDVAVVDEIQMISDPERGWAWTQAILGLQAKEIHVCGEETAVELIRKLCESTGDEFEVERYKRLTPLSVDKKGSLNGSFSKLKSGDCVIAFSRKSIFSIKAEIELATRFRVAVIYGRLPPETRTEQAKLFNSQLDNHQILVASDAIGMGLNLNIGRIIFSSLLKFDGDSMKPLSVSQAKQIAGRAGRYGTEFSDGKVTCLERRDMDQLIKYMDSTPAEITGAGILPTADQIEALSKVFPEDDLGALLRKFNQFAALSGDYHLCNIEALAEKADLIKRLDLSLRDRIVFTQAPFNLSESADMFFGMALAHSAGHKYPISQMNLYWDTLVDKSRFQSNMATLQKFEFDHRIMTLYLWLANRFPHTFFEGESGFVIKTEIEDIIANNLENISKSKRKKKNRISDRKVDSSDQ